MRLKRLHWWIIGTTIACLAIGALIFTAYRLNWTGTGFTLWDWLQLLIIPVVLAFGALLFNLATTRTEQAIAAQRYENDQKIAAQRYENDQKIAEDKQKEELLHAYLDNMSELLLKEKLRASKDDDEVRYIARARTLTVLSRLDTPRKKSLLQFLIESGLIGNQKFIIQLNGADLSGTDLRGTRLRGADLREADLSSANLFSANLSQANFEKANLFDCDLRSTNLRNTTLNGVNLYDADLSGAYLGYATLMDAHLNGANLSSADLSFASLRNADLSRVNLSEANLTGAHLVGAVLNQANLDGAIYKQDQLEEIKVKL